MGGGHLTGARIEENTLVEPKMEACANGRVRLQPQKRVENTLRLADDGEVVGNGDTLSLTGYDRVVEQVGRADAEQVGTADAALADTLLTENGIDELASVKKKQK